MLDPRQANAKAIELAWAVRDEDILAALKLANIPAFSRVGKVSPAHSWNAGFKRIARLRWRTSGRSLIGAAASHQFGSLGMGADRLAQSDFMGATASGRPLP